MKMFSTLLALLLAVPMVASAQRSTSDDISGYTRFLVYPHLQKGRESMQRGDGVRALAEFEQARRLAPGNAAVALHLAAAYRKFGEPDALNLCFSIRSPARQKDGRLRAALADLRASATAAAARDPRQRLRGGGECAVSRTATVDGAARRQEPPPTPSSRRSAAPHARGVPRDDPVPAPLAPPRALPVEVASADPSVELRASFAQALQAHRFDDAQRQADLLLAHGESGATLLDGLTYQLVAAGASRARRSG